MDSEVVVDSDVWAPEVRLNITWRVAASGLRVEVWRFLQGCWPAKYPMPKYRVLLPSRILIPPLIWKVYHFSSLGSGSSLLGQHGDNGPILVCRGQKLVIQQGILPLFGFFSDLSELFKFVLEVFLIVLFQNLTVWPGSQTNLTALFVTRKLLLRIHLH